MLKKLRVKFIALNMATVAVVLAVVFTAICVIDYQQSVARVHETLDAALAHAGDAGGGPSSGTQPGAQVPADAARANGMPPEIGGKRGGSDPAIPVAVFSVEADGSLAAVKRALRRPSPTTCWRRPRPRWPISPTAPAAWTA